ncbi:MAG: LacI family DNA-binding transcriptional regulator [Candidatus Margulisbacteria bacterium]|nr:LacI family DNA-binding transcriptional regulator [Candidatus Margulisiibacteriota bacterium]
MVNLKAIAGSCGVGISTVSTALNHPQKISRTLREKILTSARNMGYFEKNNKNVLTKVIIVADNYKNYFYGEYYQDVIFGIQQQLSSMKIPLLILSDFSIDYSEIYDYSGIIFVGRTPEEYISKAVKYKIPFILAGHPFHNNQFTCVYQNTVSGIQDLLEYVVSCGHKNIALLKGETDPLDWAWGNFNSTFLDVLKDRRIDFSDKDIFQASYHKVELVEIAVNKLLSAGKKYSVVMCSNDLLACYVYKVAEKYKIRIPAEISITGFDGINFPRHTRRYEPELTTMVADRILIGTEAVKGLILIIKKDEKYKGAVIDMVPHIGNSVIRV